MKTQMNDKTGKVATQRKYGMKQAYLLTDNRAQAVQKKELISGIQNRNTVFQFAGDYSGLLPKHEAYEDDVPTGATYHHIIPENKLKSVIPRLKHILQSDTRKESTERFGIFMGQAGEQWLRTRITNTVYAINGMYDELQVTAGEIAPILGKYTDFGTLFPVFYELLFAKLKSVYSQLGLRMSNALRTAGSYNRDELADFVAGVIQTVHCENQLSADFLTELFLQSAEKELVHKQKSKFRINKATVCAEIARLPDRIVVAEMYPNLIGEGRTSLKGILRANAVFGVEDEFDAAMCWNPGNIHRGPSKRAVEGDINYDELLDDGGEKFEKSAANLVAPAHYAELVNLNSDIESLMALAVGTEGEVALAQRIVQRMIALQEIGLTQYDKDKWVPVDPNDARNQKRRIVRDDIKLMQAGLIPPVPVPVAAPD